MFLKGAALTAGLAALVFMIWMIADRGAGERAPSPPGVAERGPAAEVTEPGSRIFDAADAEAEPIVADLIVTGVVVGEGRYPAAGIEVLLVTRFAAPIRAWTDQQGRYRLPCAAVSPNAHPRSMGATVHARAPDGRAAIGVAWLSRAVDGVLEMPKLALHRAGAG